MSQLRCKHVLSDGRVLAVCLGDLTRERVGAIVNAANEHLAHGGGLAGAIVRAGGREIQIESDALAPIATGQAVATGAGLLSCDWVIHAVGPVWNRYTHEQADALLGQAVTSALDVASDKAVVTIAFPAISSGIFGFPKDRCARVMLDAVVEYFEQAAHSSVREVRFCNFDEPTVQCFETAFEQRFG